MGIHTVGLYFSDHDPTDNVNRHITVILAMTPEQILCNRI